MFQIEIFLFKIDLKTLETDLKFSNWVENYENWLENVKFVYKVNFQAFSLGIDIFRYKPIY